MNFGIGNVALIIGIICLVYGIVVLVLWGNEDVSTERYDTLNAMSTPAFILALLGVVCILFGAANLGNKEYRIQKKYYQLKEDISDAQIEMEKFLSSHPEFRNIEELE